MLAELFQLKRNLELQGIFTQLDHRDLGTPGTSGFTTVKVAVHPDGTIGRIESLSDDEKAGLWTLKKGNFKFFPAIRPTTPPIAVDAKDELWDALKKPTVDALRTLIEENRNRLSNVDLIGGCSDQLERILRWDSKDEGSSLSMLCSFVKAFRMLATTSGRAADELVSAVLRRLTEPVTDEVLKILGTVLVGARRESKNEAPSIEYKIQFLLDFATPDDPGFTIYHPRVKGMVLKCLVAADIQQRSDNQEPLHACAISGTLQPLLEDPFSEWGVKPVISKPLPPFAKFSDAKCNFRYHRADREGFPVGAATARELVAALKRITKPEFEGRTWRSIHNGKIEQKNKKKMEALDVLIVCPSFDVQTLAAVDIFTRPASIAASNPPERHAAAKRFSERAEPLVRAMKQRISSGSIPDYLTLLLIRKISDGQMQLTYSARPTLPEFVSAIESWQASESNLPQGLRIPLPVDKAKNEFRLLTPRLLFPEEIPYLLSRQWIRDGTECTLLDGPSIGMVFDMFLHNASVWRVCAERLLDMTLARTTSLLIPAGHVLHRDYGSGWKLWRNFVAKSKTGAEDRRKPDPRHDVASALSLIGSLLYAMNSTRIRYMNETAFLVGKLLAMADELHRCYCMVVRDGDIPPSLIGNGLVGRASESPASALAELLDRSRIYVGWAKTASAPSRNKNESEQIYKDKSIAIYSARKVLRLLQPLADRLHSANGLEGELSVVDKAHLLLGYLSPVLGQSEGHPTDDSPDDDNPTELQN